MTIELQQRLNTFLLGFISVALATLGALIWNFYGGLPGDVAKIREDVTTIKNRQADFAEMHDQRFKRIEKDIDKLERR
jgi:hypothetical protein